MQAQLVNSPDLLAISQSSNTEHFELDVQFARRRSYSTVACTAFSFLTKKLCVYATMGNPHRGHC